MPLLITSGLRVPIKERYRILPRADIFKEDKKYLFLYNLYKDRDKTSKKITSFFILKL